MKKTKLQKGITLIALIITIVVLLVIAIVTIGVVQESKIIGHSQKAASDYKIAGEKEQIGIGYSEYIIEKNTTQNAQLKVKGAQVTAVGDAGWEVVFSETNSKYQLDKSGTITYIEEGEDSGEGENPGEDDKEIVIAAEKDLTVAMYFYNTMYNPEQPKIISALGYSDDGGDEYPRKSDKNEFLDVYIEHTYFDIEKDFFNQAIPEEGNITAKITHFDGTEEEITLVTTDNEKWIYESGGSALMDIDKTYIGFRPFAKSKFDIKKEEIDQYEESSDYHYMYIEGETTVPFYKLEMLDTPIEFPYNCQVNIGCQNPENEEVIPMYNKIEDVSKITVNFSDGTSKVVTQEKI